MKKMERLEMENSILRDMLSDIRESIQKLDEDATTGKEHEHNTHMALGSIIHISGDFEERLKHAERQYEYQKNRRRTSQ